MMVSNSTMTFAKLYHWPGGYCLDGLWRLVDCRPERPVVHGHGIQPLECHG
jgi:hypothetical protein